MATSCEDRKFVFAGGLHVAQSPDGRVMELGDSPKVPRCAGSVGYNMEHDEVAEDKKIAELEDQLRKKETEKGGLMMDDRLRSPSLLNPLNPLRLGWREGSLRPEGPILW